MRVFEYFFVSLLLVISTFASCRSTKSISDFREKSQINIRSADSLTLDSSCRQSEFDRMDMLVREGWEIDYTIYFPPDSAGRQSVQSRTKIKMSRDSMRNQQRMHNKDETKKVMQHNENNKSAFREIKDESEHSKCSQTNPLKYVAYILISAIILTLIYFIKRWLR